ncbi:MAG: hypothetical protein FWJ70_02515 [Micromonosporaceae bacterium]
MAVDAGGGGRAWPGLSVRPGEMRMDPDVVRAAADTLAREWESLTGQSSGSLGQLSSTTAQPAGTSLFGSWDVARAVAEGYRTGQEAIVEAYQRLVTELGHAISLLYSAAGDTERADEYSAAGFARQSAVLGEAGASPDGPPTEVREA